MDFRFQFLPYCIDRQPNGQYAVLNRKYKPVGFNTQEILEYGDYPVLVTLKDLGPKIAAKISHEGSSELGRIYLYADHCVPTASPTNMDAYLKRLAILAKLTVE